MINASDGNALTAKAPRVSYTYLGDWTWMSDAPDYALRVYQCVRAFIFDKDPDSVTVQLTDEEIAALTHRSESATKRARKSCYDHGLLWEVSRYTEHLPPREPGGRPRARTVRTLGVAVEPPEGFTGPTNCYAELKRLRREREADARGGSDLTPHTDQGQQEPSNVFAGQCEGSNSVEGRSNLNEGRPDLLHSAPCDQGEQGPQVPSQVPLQPTKGSGSDGNSLDGWLEAAPDEEPGVTAQARSLLEALVMPHGPQYEPRQAEIEHVAAALEAGASEQQVREAILSGIAKAERPAATVKHRCAGLWRLAHRGGRESGAQRACEWVRPEWCGSCEEVDRTYLDEAGQLVQCPSCHPSVVGWVERAVERVSA